MTYTKIHLVQLSHPSGRRVAMVKEPKLVLLNEYSSVYEMALKAIDSGVGLSKLVLANSSNDVLDYEEVYHGKSVWKLLPAFDNPGNPFACLVSGTGLTHKNSALNRQMMHQSVEAAPTDSMKMYMWGVEGGSPPEGETGAQPEWFYKGDGSILRAHGEALDVPEYANDGGEEPEVAGVYMVDRAGAPRRIGFTSGNEFSDHVMEKKNYLYLAPSKLRSCAIGPELVLDAEFNSFKGHVSVSRNGKEVWYSAIQSGQKNMAHTLQNLEYHHFKYAQHRLPLQAHVHFFGADAFSFGNGIQLEDNDLMEVQWEELGRALQNTLKISDKQETVLKIKNL